MALKKEVILNLNITNKEAVNNIAELSKRLDELKVKRMGLNAAVKNNIITEEEYYKSVSKLDAEIRETNTALKAYQKELSQNIAVEKSNTGSIEQMRAQLALLTKQYDALSQQDREAIGGIGEKTLLEIRQLTEELTQAEQASGRFQRAVGSYEDAIRNALSGTIPMKQALRDIKTDLQTMTLQYRQTATEIQNQRSAVEQLAQTHGTESKEYQDAKAKLDELQKAYEQTGRKIQEMTTAAGTLQDAMSDTSQAVKNAAQDAAALKGVTEGITLIADGYTALKAGMTALGIESEELMNVFARIQIIQQGVNAVNRIALALQKESVLRQQAAILWNNLTTKSIATLTAAKKQDTAATVAGTAATTAFTTAEGAATTASGGLTVAIKAVSTAIKNIPVIGWILAAVAALGTLIGLIRKANEEDKKGEQQAKERIRLLDEEKAMRAEISRTTAENTVQLQRALAHLKETKEGSKEWKTEMDNIAGILGVQNTWLINNKDKVDQLSEAFIRMKTAMATADAYAKRIADEQVKQTEIAMEYEKSLSVPYKERHEYVEQLVKDGKLLAKDAEQFEENIHILVSSRYDAYEKQKATYNKTILDNAAKASQDRVDSYMAEMSKYYNEAMDLEADFAAHTKQNIQEQQKAEKQLDDYRKKRIEAEKSMLKTVLEQTKDYLDKEREQYRINTDAAIADKERELEKTKLLEKGASGERLAELRRTEVALTREIVALRANRDRTLKQMDDKANRERLEETIRREMEIAKARISIANTYEWRKKNELDVITLQLKVDLSAIDHATEELKRKRDEITALLTADDKEVQAGLLGIDVEEYERMLNTELGKIDEDIKYWAKKRTLTEEKAAQDRIKIETDTADKIRNIQETTRNYNDEAEINARLAKLYDDEVSSHYAKELAKAQITEEFAKKRYDYSKDEYDRLGNMSEAEITAIYGTYEEYEAAMAKAKSDMEATNLAWKESLEGVKEAMRAMEAGYIDTVVNIGQAMEKVASSISGLFQTIADDNEQYQDFATTMAMAQIMISSAVAIAQAIQAAVEAGGFTGPAAITTIPTFIAELTSIVASSIASAISTLNRAKQAKVSAPQFADGGLVGGKTAHGAEGRRDDITIRASRGEFIVNAEATRKHLRELIAINGGMGDGSVFYATGGIVSQSEAGIAQSDEIISRMRDAFVEAAESITPVVSVKEITRGQQRVAVKERTSRL